MQPATNGGPSSYLSGPMAREIPIDSVDGVARPLLRSATIIRTVIELSRTIIDAGS
jgi:hypothetical protein